MTGAWSPKLDEERCNFEVFLSALSAGPGNPPGGTSSEILILASTP